MCAFQLRYDTYRSAVEEYLGGLFSVDKPYGKLQEAMRYSLMAGGKRVRPVMTLAFCDLMGGEWRRAIPFGCALELVHTYSLIHDDLPSMDDDDLRRGKPTCHKVYGEAMAVLAGDALQAEAFRIIATAPGVDDRQRAEAVTVLARACGADGMVAGQTLDILGLGRNRSELELEYSDQYVDQQASAASIKKIKSMAFKVLPGHDGYLLVRDGKVLPEKELDLDIMLPRGCTDGVYHLKVK